jgi:alpha-N-arabinofuranosidase
VWYHSHEPGEPIVQHEPWAVAPSLIEEPYTLADAVVVGTMLISLLRHADRVRIACIAQLVNAIAPIMTVTGGEAWKQTIYYPFFHASRYGRGAVLDLPLVVPTYPTARFGDAPLATATATLDEERESLVIFAVNRSLDNDLSFEGDLRASPGYRVVEHLTLTYDDPYAVNSSEQPDRVLPRVVQGTSARDSRLSAVLPRLSWNMIRLAKA